MISICMFLAENKTYRWILSIFFGLDQVQIVKPKKYVVIGLRPDRGYCLWIGFCLQSSSLY